jgi:acetyl-CoA carboxylase carboxyltransferase component
MINAAVQVSWPAPAGQDGDRENRQTKTLGGARSTPHLGLGDHLAEDELDAIRSAAGSARLTAQAGPPPDPIVERCTTPTS